MLKLIRHYFAKLRSLDGELSSDPTAGGTFALEAESEEGVSSIVALPEDTNPPIQEPHGDDRRHTTAEEQLALGRQQFEQAHLNEAIAHLRQAVLLDSTCTEAYQYLAEALREQGALAEAAICYRTAIELAERERVEHGATSVMGEILVETQSAEAEDTLAQAQQRYQQGDWDEAIAHCQAALNLLPSGSAYKLLGNAYQRKGEIDLAKTAYHRALQLEPNYAELYANLGSLAAQQQQWDEAKRHLQQAIALKPKFAGAYRNLAKVWTQLGEVEQATHCWYQALMLEPEAVSATEHVNLGNTLLVQQRVEEAIACYHQALQLDPSLVGTYQNLAEALTQQGNWQEAVECYRKALALSTPSETTSSAQPAEQGGVDVQSLLRYTASARHPGAGVIDLVMQTERYLDHQDWEQAIAVGKSALQQIEPDIAQLYRHLATALHEEQRTTEAIHYARRVVELEPDAAADWVNLGSLYAQQQQWDDAIACYETATEHAPDMASAYWNLARVWERLQQPAKSATYAFRALTLKPEWAMPEEHFELGQTLLAHQQPDAAAVCFRYLLKLDSTQATVYAALGNALVALDQLPEAIAAYQSALQMEATSDYYQRLGQALALAQQWTQAIAVYRDLIRLEPDCASHYQTLAMWLSQQQDWDGVIDCYQTLVKLTPDQWSLHQQLGDLLLQQQRSADAVPVLQQAIALNPENPRAHTSLGEAYLQLQQWSNAEEALRQAIALDLHYGWAHYHLGTVLTQAQQWDEAIAAYRRADALQPHTLRIQQGLMAALQSRAERDRQEVLNYHLDKIRKHPTQPQHYYNALSIRPEPTRLLFQLGTLLENEGQLEQAIDCFQQVVARDPHHWNGYHHLGDALLKLERWQEAIGAYRNAIALNPDFSWSHNNLGDAYLKLGLWHEAAQAFRHAIDLNPQFHWSHQNLGDALFKLERWQDAADAYRHAIAIHPDWVWSHFNLGNALAKIGRWSEAIAAYQAATQLDPTFSEAHSRLGDALARQEQWGDAIAHYETAVDLVPDSPTEIYQRLGEALLYANSEASLGAIATQQPDQQTEFPRICIVTPVYNGEHYIDDTIYSIVTQAGDFILRYHVQDGQSTDQTLNRLREWEQRLKHPDFVVLCRGIEFSFASTRDRGMYDAINQGFDAIQLHPDDYMTWLNADDRLTPGSLATITSIFGSFEQVQWVGGRTALINEDGITTKLHEPISYSNRALRAGLHDGRRLPFIMQEGTFWRASLWQTVGGVNSSFRLAGDYDLWRRFAEHAEFVFVNSVLANHRRHERQLSNNLDTYYQEIDCALGEEGTQTYDAVWNELNMCSVSDSVAQGFVGKMLDYDRTLQTWQLTKSTPGTKTNPAIVVSSAATTPGIETVFGSGFGPAEGPYPAKNLPAGIRWTHQRINHIELNVQQAGYYDIALTCQTFSPVAVRLVLAGDVIAAGSLPVTQHDRNCKIVGTARLLVGTNRLELEIVSESAAQHPRMLVVSCEGVMQHRLPSSVSDFTPPHQQGYDETGGDRPWPTTLPNGAPLPKISIVTPTYNQGAFIEETILSVIHQHYPNLEFIIVDGNSTDETMAVVNRYRDRISLVISEPDRGQSDALNKGFRQATGDILTWLNSDDRLAPGALHAVALAFYTSGADLVAGICQVFEGDRLIEQHLPSCVSGPLSLDDILDVEHSWVAGKFFYQPEVMFTREIWEKAGASVNESLYYSMDYELWARFAAAGANIHVMGYPVAHYRMHPAQKTNTLDAYQPELLATRDALRHQFQRSVSSAISTTPQHAQLRIVCLNDVGFYGGAGIAHERIVTALGLAGHDVIPIAGRATWQFAPLDGSVSDVMQLVTSLEPDLVVVGNVHNLSFGVELLEQLSDRVPTIFVMHDQWLMTGRCAYVGSCQRYISGCSNQCPTSHDYPRVPVDQIADIFQQKRSLLQRDNLLVLGDSHWITNWARSAYLASVDRPLMADAEKRFQPIHYGLDTTIFRPLDQAECRQKLGLPADKFIILTGSQAIDEVRKGVAYLFKALEIADLDNVLLLSFGHGTATHSAFELQCIGYVQDAHLLATYYSAADLFVGPSLEEAFGQTFIEAAACGTPAVGFAVGGVPEAIRDRVSGRIVPETTPEALADMLLELYCDRAQLLHLSRTAPLFVASQFSFSASYHTWVEALSRAGWNQRLGLCPNTTFAVTTAHQRQPIYLYPDGTSDRPPQDVFSGHQIKGRVITGFGDLEPFYPQDGDLIFVRWAYWHQSRFVLSSQTPRVGQLHLRCRSFIEGQHIELWQEEVGLLAQAQIKPGASQVLKVAIDLNRGANFFSLTTSKRQVDRSNRHLGVLIEAIEFSETVETAADTSAKQPSAVHETHLRLDHQLSGSGWYAPEYCDRQPVRWMEKVGTILFYHSGYRPTHLRLVVMMATDPDFLSQVSLHLNGHLLARYQLQQIDQCWVYDAEIPSQLIADQGSHVLTIKAPDVKQLSSADSRRASLLVKDIALLARRESSDSKDVA